MEQKMEDLERRLRTMECQRRSRGRPRWRREGQQEQRPKKKENVPSTRYSSVRSDTSELHTEDENQNQAFINTETPNHSESARVSSLRQTPVPQVTVHDVSRDSAQLSFHNDMQDAPSTSSPIPRGPPVPPFRVAEENEVGDTDDAQSSEKSFEEQPFLEETIREDPST